MNIYNIGSLNIDYVYSMDHFVQSGETLSSTDMKVFPGGKGLNQSVALSKAGAKVIHGAIVGKDGDFLLETLKGSGVDVSGIEKSDSLSGHAIIEVDKSGQNRILLYSGTNSALSPEYINRFLSGSNQGDIVLIQNETNCLDEIFIIAKEKNLDIAFNPSPIDDKINQLPLEQVKWWFVNEIEAALLFGNGTPEQIAERFIEKYPNSNLILTLGCEGSVFCNKDNFIRQGIFEVIPQDTTAAGDTFTGFFLANVINGKDFKYSLKVASVASGIAVSRKGASVSIPTAKEVEENI